MNCKSVQIYLSAYLDGELCGQECLQVRDHLSGCEECRIEEQQLRSLKHMLRGLPNYNPSEGFEDRLVATVMKKSERRAIFTWNLDWRFASSLAAVSVIAAFALFQLTERRVPSAEAQPMANLDVFERDLNRDQMFMNGNDPLSSNRFASYPTYGKK